MDIQILKVYFYKNNTGSEPVREWILKLNKADKKIIGEDIKTVQIGWPLGMPLVKNISNGLWEVRSNLSSNKIARIIFCMHSERIILLHGFIKKTKKTMKKDYNLALNRMKEVKNG